MQSTIFRIVTITLLFLCANPSALLAGGWGLESGRAGPDDAAKLVIDQVAVRRAQTRIADAVLRPTLAERQAGLVRNDDGTRSGQMVDRLDAAYQWWLKSVMEPAKAIVVNPAASCEEAQVSMQNLVSMMQSRNALGLDTEFNEMFDEIQTKGFQRCREEAFDECLVTGRFRQIVETAISQQRSALKTGTDAAEGAEEWADKALKQCAIYDLEFTSNTTTAQIFNLETVRRSKIRLEFKLENGIVEALLTGKLSDVLKGETLGDVLLDSVKCAQPPLDVRCKPGEILSQNFAKVLTLDLKHREFYVDPRNGMSQVRIAGEDNLAFEFGGGMYDVNAQVIIPRFGPVPIPMKAMGYGFYVAHNKDRLGAPSGVGAGGSTVKVERNKRGAYPILFDFIYADHGTESNATVADSTEFKLVHKPKASDAPVEKPGPKKTPLRRRMPRRNG